VKIDVTGKITAVSMAAGITTLTAPTASDTVLVLKNAASQSEDIFQHQNSAGTVQASLDENGRLTVRRLTETDTITYTSYSPGLHGRTSGGQVGNGTTDAYYDQFRKRVHAYGKLTRGSTTQFGSGGAAMDLPVDAANFTARRMVGTGLAYDASTGTRVPLWCSLDQDDRILWLTEGGVIVDFDVPFTWTTSDELHWTIEYEAA
jgi:hypothetical protein